jgi:hypothetical protein
MAQLNLHVIPQNYQPISIKFRIVRLSLLQHTESCRFKYITL